MTGFRLSRLKLAFSVHAEELCLTSHNLLMTMVILLRLRSLRPFCREENFWNATLVRLKCSVLGWRSIAAGGLSSPSVTVQMGEKGFHRRPCAFDRDGSQVAT